MERRKRTLVVLEELREFVVPLTPEEFNHLEVSILSEGCRDRLVVWERTPGELVVVDGHNRYAICTKHVLSFDYEVMKFADIDHAKLWMIANQIGRRNLTTDQLSYYRGLKYLSLRKRRGGFDKVDSKGCAHEPTAISLAKEFKVSASTIKRDCKFAERLNAIGRTDPELKRKILTGELKVRKLELTALTEYDDQDEGMNYLRRENAVTFPGTEPTPSVRINYDKLKRLKGKIIGALNRVYTRRMAEDMDELKTLISKFEMELFETSELVENDAVSKRPS